MSFVRVTNRFVFTYLGKAKMKTEAFSRFRFY